MSVLKRWAGTKDISDTDRAAATRVLDALAAHATSGDDQQDDVQSSATLDQRVRDSTPLSSGGSSSAATAKLPGEIAQRCEGTAGDWCGRYLVQQPIPAKASLQADPLLNGKRASYLNTRLPNAKAGRCRTSMQWQLRLLWTCALVCGCNRNPLTREPVSRSGAAARQQELPGRLQQRRGVPGGLRLLPLPRRLGRRRLH